MFENLDWTVVVSSILGLISVVFGAFWAKVQGKLGKVVVLGKEFVDVVEVFEEAMKDDSLTKEEVEAIKKEFEEAKAAFKSLIEKE